MHLEMIELMTELFPSGNLYPYNLPLVRRLASLTFDAPLTFFVGENGSGKTTVLEAIAARAGIHIWRYTEGARFRPNPYEHTLGNYVRLHWRDGRVPGAFFSSQSHRDFSLLLDEWASSDPGQFDHYGGASLVTQSHGQSIMSYLRSLYGRRGLYFADEPETALSPRRLLELARLLHESASKGDAQFIIATHSPILLAVPGALIYSFAGESVEKIAYEDTEHCRIYREFMENPRGCFDPGEGRQR